MSQITDEAYTELCNENERLKKERQTVDELSGLVKRLCDAMDDVFKYGGYRNLYDSYDLMRDLEAHAKGESVLKEAREAIQ